MDSDDIMLPERIVKQLEFMEKKETYFKEFFGNGELRYIVKKLSI